MDSGGRGLIGAGGVRAMIVGMMDPDADRFASLAFGVEIEGVEAFLDKDSLVALDFPVVPVSRLRTFPAIASLLRRPGGQREFDTIPRTEANIALLPSPHPAESDADGSIRLHEQIEQRSGIDLLPVLVHDSATTFRVGRPL